MTRETGFFPFASTFLGARVCRFIRIAPSLRAGSCLYAGDVLILESFLIGGRGSILYLRPTGDESRMAAAVLYEYAAHKLMTVQDRQVRLYPGEVTRGPALRKFEQLLASQEQESQAAAVGRRSSCFGARALTST